MNNYDVSSTGENIEFNCFYDSDLSQIYYDCFESENTRLSFGRDNSLFLLGDASAPYFKKAELNKMKKSALWANFINYELGYDSDAYLYTKADIIRELHQITINQHYERLISEYNWHDIGENIAHDYYISRGYSQSDSVYIVSIDNPIDNSLRRYINNILWDSPINIYANINGLEFHTDDFLNDDFYQYDAEAIAEKIRAFNISEYAKAWLIKALPDSPSY